MKIETIEQRDQRERDLSTKRMVLQMAMHTRDSAQKVVDRLAREIAELEAQQ